MGPFLCECVLLFYLFHERKSDPALLRSPDSVRTELKGLSSYGNTSTAGDRQKLLVTVTQVKKSDNCAGGGGAGFLFLF